ncbi:MAG: hypothetical protein HFF79_08160 [Oscillospiraceae bacterium]|nr:hypothetical protein [Oscillospiraceae bacterium]
MYIDFNYYKDIYGGSLLTKDDFATAAKEAEDYIRYLTYIKGDIFADTAQADAIKNAVCAAAEAYSRSAGELSEGGNIKSESRDGFSVSFVVSQKDGESRDDYVKRYMYQVIRARLLPTGWLSRRVGCKYVHKCGCNDNF